MSWAQIDTGEHDAEQLASHQRASEVECGSCRRRFTGELARAHTIAHWRLAHTGAPIVFEL